LFNDFDEGDLSSATLTMSDDEATIASIEEREVVMK
jgi:hypothetical protein